MNTREHIKCAYFGAPEDLGEVTLPTYRDVMKCYHYWRLNLKTNKRELSSNEIIEQLLCKLQHVWKLASIPTVSKQRIIKMIKDYHDKLQRFKKNKPKKGPGVAKFNAFISTADQLFDICSCKCISLDKCNCSLSFKIPKEEHQFLIDQRSERKMSIGCIDVNVTKRNLNKVLRNKSRSNSSQPIPSTSQQGCFIDSYIQSNSSSSEADDPGDASFKPSGRQTQTNAKISITCDFVAEICDRSNVSDRNAALIVSSALAEVATAHGKELDAVDKNKLRRARKRTREECLRESFSNEIQSLYFDGRKDRTLTIENIDGSFHKRFKTEEHYVIIEEPGSKYLWHVSPESGSAQAICKEIVMFLGDNKINTDNLVALGCDGTAVNTGRKAGVIKRLEHELQRPLQWIVCLMHANELPLRHLIEETDGKTTGPTGFHGPIGKLLSTCEERPIVEYDSIPSEDINCTPEDLSTDQQYLLQVYQAISTGICSPRLANKTPGKMSHSRWLTTGSRLLRHYMSESSPSQNLIRLTTYIMKVYVPVWFAIKKHTSFTNGAKHFYKLLVSIQKLDTRTKTITNKVLMRNAFFAHAENILVAMIHDENRVVRQLGWKRILKARSNKNEHIRDFEVPKINLKATSYIDMLNWQDCQLTEPPVTVRVSDEDLNKLAQEANQTEKLVHHFPCHTQAVERAVKLVTEVSLSVSGQRQRHGMIKNKIVSRAKIPKFDSKQNFKF